MKRSWCASCCSGDHSISDGEAAEDVVHPEELGALKGGMNGAMSDTESVPDDVPANFMQLSSSNPWLVCRSPQHGGKLFWMHRQTHETTWRQPLPRIEQLTSALANVNPSMRETCFVVVEPVFFGA
jgi:hypothetical protein